MLEAESIQNGSPTICGLQKGLIYRKMKSISFPSKKLDQRVDSNNPLIQPMAFNHPKMDGSAGIAIISCLDIGRVVQEFRSRPKEGLSTIQSRPTNQLAETNPKWELHQQKWWMNGI